MKRSATSLIVSTVMLCTVGATSQIQAADTLAKIKSTGKIVITTENRLTRFHMLLQVNQ
ncbi:hypothetical protein AB3515_11145 [Acinetobacter baumannii]